ncbi:MAG: cyclomaltodextrinase [Synergistaceae bacterium]|jgi:glycosidase|nr:cyclomaltodextrinase [Synergistaceae bacterium]
MLSHNDLFIYHIYTFSLANAPFHNEYGQPSDKTGMIARWIPHIRRLGCNAALFSPVLKSRSHGYDVTDYFQIDNRLGTNDDFRKLVGAFHENGIRVMLDSVFNHCGRDFFAFQELRNGSRAYADWFSGVDFSRRSPLGDPFTYDTWAGYHELVKFNLQNEAARNYLLDAARFWLDEFDVDGMRLDSANVLDFGFMRELRRVLCEKKADFWLMGEVVAGDYTKWANPETLHSVTNYMLYKSLFSSHNDNNLYELASCVQKSVPDNGLPLYSFLDNHDQPRIASTVKNAAHLKTLYALLFTLPGIPSIYYGSEWGIRGVKENGSDAPLRPYIDIDAPPVTVEGLEDYIRRLAEVRRGHNALKYGSYRRISIQYRRPFVFERSHDGRSVFVAVNINEHADVTNLGAHCKGSLIDLLTGERFDGAGQIALSPCSARVLAAE